MKTFIKGRFKIMLIAMAILVVCATVFAVSTQIAMGAEESKAVLQRSTYAESAADSSEAAGYVTPDLITQQDAIEAFMWIASNIFETNIDESTLTVRFNDKVDIKDENGNILFTNQAFWSVENSDFSSAIDAVTGTVIGFTDMTDDYPGESIMVENFNKDFYSNIYDEPDNIYITAARNIVETKLSEGRKIDSIEVDGIQFVWDNDIESPVSGTPGTIQVDCHVYMETGMCYTLSFWGTDEIKLKKFYSHPNKNACKWGYFYGNPEDYPPSAGDDGWYTAPGITYGTYVREGGRQ